MSRPYLGLISGTSVDTVDAVIASFEPSGGPVRLLHAHGHPIPPRLRRDLLEVAAAERTTHARIARLDVEVGHLFADAALSAIAAAGLDPAGIAAVGSHGQTVRHDPDGRWPSTTQIGDPNVIAQRTGITTVADFRRRDIAAGGQGAPLAPAFHQAVMSHPSARRAIVNLGGIANVSLLAPTDSTARDTLGFDCGPANGLLDAWARRHLDAPFDEDGGFAAQGTVHEALLERMRADPYFSQPAPKSTGRGYFDEGWIDRQTGSVGGRPRRPGRRAAHPVRAHRRDGRGFHRGVRSGNGRGVPVRRRGAQPDPRRAPVRPARPPQGGEDRRPRSGGRPRGGGGLRLAREVRPRGAPGQPPFGDRSEGGCGARRGLSRPRPVRFMGVADAVGGRNRRSRRRLGRRGGRARPPGRDAQIENERPQPQVVLALGFRTTNWEPCRSSW